MHAEAYKTLQDALGDAIEEVVTEGTQPFARVRADAIVEAAKTLREKCGADMLHLVSGTDFKDRFEPAHHNQVQPAGDAVEFRLERRP